MACPLYLFFFPYIFFLLFFYYRQKTNKNRQKSVFYRKSDPPSLYLFFFPYIFFFLKRGPAYFGLSPISFFFPLYLFFIIFLLSPENQQKSTKKRFLSKKRPPFPISFFFPLYLFFFPYIFFFLKRGPAYFGLSPISFFFPLYLFFIIFLLSPENQQKSTKKRFLSKKRPPFPISFFFSPIYFFINLY